MSDELAVATLATGYGELRLPPARGPWTSALYALLEADPVEAAADAPADPVPAPLPSGAGLLADDDLQLALYLCYELHYSGLAGVDDRFEWSPSVLAFRGSLERAFEQALHDVLGNPEPVEARVGAELQRLMRADAGPPLSTYIERRASLEEAIEFVVHRSAYQLKEADPHSWVLPRLRGAPKAALVEIQGDEYGEGRPEQMHAELFAATMRALGLDSTPGSYVQLLPGITLATVNLMSLFGLNRRLRGALVGHLAVFELTSSVPNRRYANGWRRLGMGEEVTRFHDVHVVADAVHESIATWDLADALARQQPALADSILFGARALLKLEALWGEHLLTAWARGESSLLGPLVADAG